jgi:hypothetical protein
MSPRSPGERWPSESGRSARELRPLPEQPTVTGEAETPAEKVARLEARVAELGAEHKKLPTEKANLSR